MYKIFIDRLPPRELNPNWRGHWEQWYTGKRKFIKPHWTRRYKAFQEYKQFVSAICIDQRNINRWCTLDKAIIYLNFKYRDNRMRDFDNVLASAKPLIDGLVDARLIKQDDHKHMEFGGIKIDSQQREEGVEVCLLECSPVPDITLKPEILTYIMESCCALHDPDKCRIRFDCQRFFDSKV